MPSKAIQIGSNPGKEKDLDEETLQQRQNDKERVRQLEGMAAGSLGHQQRMLALIQVNRELEAKNGVAKGKSTQATNEWRRQKKGKEQSNQNGRDVLGWSREKSSASATSE